MADKEPKILGEEDFLRQAELIHKQVAANDKLTSEGKRATLTVLAGIVKSVKVHGARQHGITKKMLKVALTVFAKMADDKRHSAEQLAVLRSLTMITLEGIKAK
ncbi:hypothetical protein SDC9_35155 [bioreactor metagenome]|jgi:hypothetical protein|uniref:Uncharacterized protein n=1 Tax=bioreactor metagenome TaxID=1076179 RepID=A0A644VCN6_9ZZZZ|nr:hypothetical protein [Acidaminococcaceae bacterium]